MFLNPIKEIEKFDLMPGIKAADFGCGSGHFTVEIAKRVGGGGIVYAIDVQKEALEAVKVKAKSAHLDNIELIRANLESERGTGLKDELVDFVLISNVLFQVEDKVSIAQEAYRILKVGGRLVVIDWETKTEEQLGPPKQMRMNKEDIKRIFTEAGFKEEKIIDAGESHYGLIFNKT